ncbi:MAG: TIGR01777 family oxidoreductase [Maribacter sp.]|nr:TIGR01777 family oxidoreductase [Maribacter sp.]
MKILVTGATGLIGREIVELSNKQGIPVNYLTTRRDKIVSNENFQGFYWNPTTKEIDIKCFEGVTGIINLAGANISNKWTSDYKNQILSSRLNSIKTLTQALGKIDSKHITSFVSASATGIYPSSLSNYYIEEEKKIDDSFLGEVVDSWEKEIDTLGQFGFLVAKIRIGMVLSLDGGALPKLAKAIRSYVGAPFGTGRQWQSWIHVSDLARMFLFITQNGLNGIYNGVSPNPVTNAKMIKEMAKTLDKPLILPRIPKFVLHIILGQKSYLLFSSQRVSSKKIAEEGFVFEYPNITNALEQFYNNTPS